MSFLQPILLLGLPLALLPIIIHLINQHRHRTVEWAAMMFLLDAKKLTKGIARLRQILILSLRVLAVILLIFAAGRPLAGGWLAMTGGKADTVLILLDRSASMEQQNLETGESKRSTALRKLADLLSKTANNSEIVLIDSATLTPTTITDPEGLLELPETSVTATASKIPALLQIAVDYLATDESGRTDIWLASDLRQSDWDPGSGQWQALRAELAANEASRLLLLSYPATDTANGNLSISVSKVGRRRAPEGMQLVLDFTIRRQSNSDEPTNVPLEFTVNEMRTVQEIALSGKETVRLGHVIPLGRNNGKGWGRIDLPADDNPADNTAFLVFADPPVRKTVVVSDDQFAVEAITAAARAALETDIQYEADTVGTDQLSRIPWEDTALLFWQAPIPAPDSPESALLSQHLATGRTLVFLPPAGASDHPFKGFSWEDWTGGGNDPLPVEWWRTETSLLANTQSGESLPVDDLNFFRVREFSGDVQPLLRTGENTPVIAKLISETPGSAYAWGTLPRTDHSSLATDGIVFFVMLHRALEEGANAVAPAQFRETGSGAIPDIPYSILAQSGGDASLTAPGLLPTAISLDAEGESRRLMALNRPVSEDDLKTLRPEAIASLLEGVNYRQVSDELNSGSSLASEVWRAFLVIMSLALLAEAILSLPARTEAEQPVVGLR
ncbi:MAG: BatA domain-containing protein [Verrucomicrobiales bacterium]|nr:BatA domain-containing protein [Verrucomicrobiales bacterium]